MVSAEQFKLNLPKPRFAPIRIGQSTQKSRLDSILDAAKIRVQDYILYVEAI